MAIEDHEEAAFESLVMEIRDQVSALTRQLKVKYVQLLKLKMRVHILGAEDLTEESEREALERLPKEVAVMEKELARHQGRLSRLRNA
jgi:hypothetical protein